MYAIYKTKLYWTKELDWDHLWLCAEDDTRFAVNFGDRELNVDPTDFEARGLEIEKTIPKDPEFLPDPKPKKAPC